ncbi:MAG TPA: type VI secretion system contractile sheath large subunit [Thermoanaerobaculia bacterium]|jgi:type VI secretion system protein ImpC|nr:type VI secretion system contractile sheath large subunit [Thermoanaerobaculia bacterium]
MADETPEATAPETAPAAAAGAAAGGSLLDQIVDKGKMARDESQKARAKDLVGEFVHQILDEGMTVSRDTLAMIQVQIARIDELLSTQLNEVLHHPDFQKLEASWRGLHFLVMNTETSTRLKLRLLCAAKNEVFKDLDQALEFDQSVLFKKVYEEEYGTFGGHPYSLLIGDYEFGRHPQDMALLEKIAGVAAAAHAPFIAAASPKLFDMDSFTELGNPRDLAKLFESTELIKWRSFQQMEDSRYVTLALPHILLRLPYGPNTVPTEDFKLVEDTDGKDHSKYLWGNAAWALGQRITNAFALYGWCAAIRGVEGGGMVQGLPTHTFKTDEGDIALKCPTEIAITDRREKELDTLGFVALCHCKGTDYAAFFGGQTTQKPKSYDTDAANANARISARLPYILNASRFAHYLKVICRDKVGSFQTKDTMTTYLNRWISGYILGTDDAGQDLKAQYPLREARIDVFDVPGKPGAYRAVAFLRPHFQLEELTASIRLVAELPPPAA